LKINLWQITEADTDFWFGLCFYGILNYLIAQNIPVSFAFISSQFLIDGYMDLLDEISKEVNLNVNLYVYEEIEKSVGRAFVQRFKCDCVVKLYDFCESPGYIDFCCNKFFTTVNW